MGGGAGNIERDDRNDGENMRTLTYARSNRVFPYITESVLQNKASAVCITNSEQHHHETTVLKWTGS